MSASNDSASVRMFIFILAALVAFTLIVIIMANTVGGDLVDKVRDANDRELIAQRIAPVGKVNVAAAPEAAAPAAAVPTPAAAPAPAPAPAEAASPVAAISEAVSSAADAAGAAVSDVAETVSDAASGAMQAVGGAVGGADLAKGKGVYDSACFVCHASGAAGAPKLGDKAAWAPRLAKGEAALAQSAIGGIGAMPPKGGRIDLSDADIQAAVAFIMSKGR